MNIAIDITPLETGHGRRGVGVYTRSLIESLKHNETNHTYSFFTRKQNIPKNADIVHYPYFDPFFLTLPLMKEKPTVVTVHDLIPLVFPSKFPSGIRGQIKWQIQRYSLGGVRRIIADSETSKNDIARITGISKATIDPIYLAPGIAYTSVQGRSPLSSPYILYVGDVNWNKNVHGLIQAFGQVKDAKLVLVGAAFKDRNLAETREIDQLIKKYKLESRVVRPGFVAEQDLASLYSHATCLVAPSFYEGFGLPVLEAMACECPVVCSNTSSLTEIAGPAITTSTTPESIKGGISRILGFSPGERKKLIDAQNSWVQKFTWKKVARQTIASYERALL